jgi:excisionase family DNA binding protein
MDDDQKVLTTRQAAKMLDVSLRTVQLWVESGVLNAWKTPGGHRKVSLKSIEQILENRKSAIQNEDGRKKRSNQDFSILVVEDDEALRNLFHFYFSNWKIKVNLNFAKNGFEGLTSLGKEPPNLIITDLLMPGMDGFEMIRHLKQSPEYGNLEIIVITGLSDDDIQKNGGLPENVRCFRKPLSFDVIESAVAASIERKPNA